ncbi:MAG: helix-turn-helix domain-containing protein [Myxococcales bacterium]|nr:helix-turn-helix domain-containing protein [Myxococcales bacterium]
MRTNSAEVGSGGGGGGELRRRRQAVGDSQRAAARRLGVPADYLEAVERGERPQLSRAASLVAAASVLYGVPVSAWIETAEGERRVS